MAPWTGTFTSSAMIGMWPLKAVCGNIEVDLPDDIQTLDSTATFTYTGMYRNGQTTQYAFKYAQQKGQGQQAGVCFKGTGPGDQTIDFAVSSNNTTTIAGTYTSLNPSDAGTFELSKK